MGFKEVIITPLGWLLRGKRAGERNSYKHYSQLSTEELFELSSPAFPDGGRIPERHSGLGRGENISPELNWTALPPGTKHLLLIMEDIDVPFDKPILHVTALFEPTFEKLPEGALAPNHTEIFFIQGRKGRKGYHGPRPLPGHGRHRYRFHLYALDEALSTDREYTDFAELLPLVDGHVIARAHLEGIQIG